MPPNRNSYANSPTPRDYEGGNDEFSIIDKQHSHRALGEMGSAPKRPPEGNQDDTDWTNHTANPWFPGQDDPYHGQTRPPYED